MKPSCKIVSMTSKPVESVLCAWFNSRDMRMPGKPWVASEFYQRLYSEWEDYTTSATDFFILKALVGERWVEPQSQEQMDSIALDLFYSVLQIDAPIQEFIQFHLTFSNVPRTFVDQLDRTRQAGFWEQSIRVKDLNTFADQHEYFSPPDCDNPVICKEYDLAMRDSQRHYARLRELGMRPEHARGVAPLHVNTRADMTVNLRTLRFLISKRTCYFAQGDYWRPVVLDFFTELPNCDMPKDPRTINLFTGLPCDRQGSCPYYRDLMDRLTDKSNPICPILFNDLDQDNKQLTVDQMDKLYSLETWIKGSTDYLISLNRESDLSKFNSYFDDQTGE